jgi:hypothetical protein
MTGDISRRKLAPQVVSGLCLTLTVALLMGCTRANQQRDTSNTPVASMEEIGQKAMAGKDRSGLKAQTASDLMAVSEIAGF